MEKKRKSSYLLLKRQAYFSLELVVDFVDEFDFRVEMPNKQASKDTSGDDCSRYQILTALEEKQTRTQLENNGEKLSGNYAWISIDDYVLNICIAVA